MEIKCSWKSRFPTNGLLRLMLEQRPEVTNGKKVGANMCVNYFKGGIDSESRYEKALFVLIPREGTTADHSERGN